MGGIIVAKVLLIFQQINIRSLIFNDPDELFFIFFFAKYLRSVTLTLTIILILSIRAHLSTLFIGGAALGYLGIENLSLGVITIRT